MLSFIYYISYLLLLHLLLLFQQHTENFPLSHKEQKNTQNWWKAKAKKKERKQSCWRYFLIFFSPSWKRNSSDFGVEQKSFANIPILRYLFAISLLILRFCVFFIPFSFFFYFALVFMYLENLSKKSFFSVAFPFFSSSLIFLLNSVFSHFHLLLHHLNIKIIPNSLIFSPSFCICLLIKQNSKSLVSFFLCFDEEKFKIA